MLVYRYTSKDVLWKIISHGRLFLKVSRPCEFNDSFECTGCFKGEFRASFIEDFSRAFEIKDAGQDVRSVATSIGMSSLFSHGHCFDGLARFASFCDATTTSAGDDLLMWSHYGDKARGVRLAIEFDESEFKMRKVKYRKNRPVLNCSKARHYSLSDSEFGRFMFACLTTKCKSWGYENEARLILPLDDSRLRYATAQDVCKPKHERDYLLELPNTCLREIALGVRTVHVGDAQAEMERVRAMGFKHVDFRLCRIDSDVNEYKYQYRDLYIEDLYKHPEG